MYVTISAAAGVKVKQLPVIKRESMPAPINLDTIIIKNEKVPASKKAPAKKTPASAKKGPAKKAPARKSEPAKRPVRGAKQDDHDFIDDNEGSDDDVEESGDSTTDSESNPDQDVMCSGPSKQSKAKKLPVQKSVPARGPSPEASQRLSDDEGLNSLVIETVPAKGGKGKKAAKRSVGKGNKQTKRQRRSNALDSDDGAESGQGKCTNQESPHLNLVSTVL